MGRLRQWRGPAEARTAALNLFVVVEAFYLFSCRSLTRSAWRLGMFANRWIILGTSVRRPSREFAMHIYLR